MPYGLRTGDSDEGGRLMGWIAMDIPGEIDELWRSCYA